MISKIRIMYEKYYSELMDLQQVQKSRYSKLNAHYDDIECELLYMFVRESQPNHLIEFSPQFGWSTSWILEALNKNKNGKCISYDLHNTSVVKLNELKGLDLSRWEFIKGDVQSHYKSF